MLQININTQPTRLEYSINNAKLNLQTTRPILEMETTPALLETRQPRGELSIDNTPCRASLGIKNNADFARDNAELGRQTVLNTMARIAQEGTQYARIESNSNAFADIAAAATFTEVPEITLGHLEAPEIHYQANPVEFNANVRKVNFNVQPSTVQGDYQPGSVDFRVAQYSSIQFSTVDIKV